jgi:long-chain acyl-CoA synthetase
VTTIYGMFQDTVSRFADRRALAYKVRGTYNHVTYGELNERMRDFRRGLAALGVSRGDRVAVLSYNRVEWAVTDLAVHGIGAVLVPIYHTLPPVQVEHYLRDSGAAVIVVEDAKQYAKIAEVRDRIPALRHVALMSGEAVEGVLSWQDVVEMGRKSGIDDADLDTAAAAIDPADVATFIYTSGTTGAPKGAMLSHTALLNTWKAAVQIVRLDETDIFLSFLPLCHVVERVAGHYLPLAIGAQIYYSDGPFGVANEIATIRPTLFICVPRLFEAIEEKVREHGAKLPPLRRKVFDWALKTGEECAAVLRDGGALSATQSAARALADKLVLSKVREKVTGGRARYFVSGGAPLGVGTASLFSGVGVPMLEGYGLTESPVLTLNRPGKARLGTVGTPLPGIEISIAADGEVLGRGPCLMDGYYNQPEATAAAIDADGWFHTGDIGVIDEHGHLHITDRKKDIIVLANGKNVAPQPIEARIKRSPFVSEVVLIGDRQNVIHALVVPTFDRVKIWAAEQGLAATEPADLARAPEVVKLIKGEVDRVSQDLADYERIRKIALLDHSFTIEGGELTPTLKVKRSVVSQKYGSLLGGG